MLVVPMNNLRRRQLVWYRKEDEEEGKKDNKFKLLGRKG
jgi:hypothetical protein